MTTMIKITITQDELLQLAKSKAKSAGLDASKIKWTVHSSGVEGQLADFPPTQHAFITPNFGTESQTFEEEAQAFEDGVQLQGVDISIHLFGAVTR